MRPKLQLARLNDQVAARMRDEILTGRLRALVLAPIQPGAQPMSSDIDQRLDGTS